MEAASDRPTKDVSIAPPKRRRAALVGVLNQYLSVLLMVVQGFLLVPLYLKFIPVEAYGAWLATGNIIAWLAFVDPGASMVVQQRAAHAYGENRVAALGDVIGSGIVINCCISIVLAIGAAAVAPLVPVLVGKSSAVPAELGTAFIVAGCSEAILLVALALANVLMGLMAFPVTTGAVYVVATAAGIGVNVWLLYQGAGILAIPGGLLARAGLLLLSNAILLYRAMREMGVKLRVSRAEVRGTLRLSAYTWMSRTVGSLLSNVDGLLVARYLGVAQVPVYVLTRRAAEVVGQASSRVGNALSPGMSHLKGEGRLDMLRSVAERLLATVGWISAIGAAGYVALNRSFMHLWVGSELFGGQWLTTVVGIGLVVAALESASSCVAFAAGEIGAVSRVSSVTSIVRVIVMLLLLSVGAGMFAMPAASILASACIGLPQYGKALQHGLAAEVGWARRRAAGLMVQAAAVIVLGALAAAAISLPGSWPLFIAEACAVAGAALLALWSISSRFRSELRSAWAWVRARRGARLAV